MCWSKVILFPLSKSLYILFTQLQPSFYFWPPRQTIQARYENSTIPTQHKEIYCKTLRSLTASASLTTPTTFIIINQVFLVLRDRLSSFTYVKTKASGPNQKAIFPGVPTTHRKLFYYEVQAQQDFFYLVKSEASSGVQKLFCTIFGSRDISKLNGVSDLKMFKYWTILVS